jgi:hypothetical protein
VAVATKRDMAPPTTDEVACVENFNDPEGNHFIVQGRCTYCGLTT